MTRRKYMHFKPFIKTTGLLLSVLAMVLLTACDGFTYRLRWGTKNESHDR
jgi:hypothetical protein